MIRKYIYGQPFPTEAVIREMPSASGSLPYFETDGEGNFFLHLADEDIVYGLGETMRGINKRGFEYVSWNFDIPHHHEDKRSLYGSHNFIIVSGSKLFGVFFDYAGQLRFDIGYTQRDEMRVSAATPDLVVYVIDGESEKEIVRQFRGLIGRSYLPPMWAFGYGQSRWGYENETDIREVAQGYQKAGIPLESIYMDIDYMERFKDFTVNDERFPDLAGLAREMKAEGIHLVPIIDAGVKIERGYDVYEEGVERGYFCKNAEGGDFVGAVWPGLVHFPDFLNPDARRWFGQKYARLTSQGIDGFWNDMNEPAIFYTQDRLAALVAAAKKLDNPDATIEEYFDFTDKAGVLSCNKGDYDKFFHKVGDQMVMHSQVHNLFGMNMTRAANEALSEIVPDKRTLFFSRSSYIGAHRYGGIWQGDNNSWWSHILQAMQQLPALNMSGFLYIGADTGGFGCDVTEDLMIRWLQYSLFTPLFRNHSANGTRRQELYRFSTVETMGEMVKIRYSLIPYLYSEFLKAMLKDDMMFRPLAFDFPEDEMAKGTEDQLLLGDELMIAPVYKQNAKGRYVYLPEEMMMVRMRKYDDYEKEILPAGHHYVKADLSELVFFIRKDQAIPFYTPAKNTALIDDSAAIMLGYAGAHYQRYKDDGISPQAEDSLMVMDMF